jgi:hypothetical protein
MFSVEVIIHDKFNGVKSVVDLGAIGLKPTEDLLVDP